MREGHRIGHIERAIGRKLEEARIPRGRDICEARLMDLLSRVTTVEVNQHAVGPYLNSVRESLADLDREELLQRFISVEFNRFLEQYAGAPDLNPAPHQARSGSQPKKSRGPSKGIVRLRLNIGRRQAALPPQIIGLVNRATNSGDIWLGRIDIGPNSSDVQVDGAMAGRIEEALAGSTYQGTQLQVERVREERPATGKRGAPGRQRSKNKRPNDRPGGKKGKRRRS